MPTFTRNDALAAESYWARQLHVPEDLAHAVAQVESRHNPYAVGDHGTSFGDYQLHRGGMLGSLTPSEAFDPMLNAKIAVANLAYTLQRHPEVQDPGMIAALSQRPADPAGYARKVDAAMQTGRAGSSSAGVQNVNLGSAQPASFYGSVTGPGNWLWDHTGGYVLHGVGNVAGDVGGAISAPFVAIFNLLKTIWDFFTSADTWIRIGLFVGGAVIVIVGVRAITGGGSGGTMVVPV